MTQMQNYVPDCNLASPVANGECGVFDNRRFGQPIPTTRYSDDVIRGWGNRFYNWLTMVEIDQQLTRGVSVQGTYIRRTYGNLSVTDNLAVTPKDFDPYC